MAAVLSKSKESYTKKLSKNKPKKTISIQRRQNQNCYKPDCFNFKSFTNECHKYCKNEPKTKCQLVVDEALVITEGKCVQCYNNNQCTEGKKQFCKDGVCIVDKVFDRNATTNLGQEEIQSRVYAISKQIQDISTKMANDLRGDIW